MTDSVRCSLDSSKTFTCEVHIDSDFAPPDSASTSNAPAAPTEASPNPAVSSLVRAYSKTVVPPADAPIVSADSLETCVSAELSLPIAFATAGYLGPIAGFKAGFDTGQCLASEQQRAIERATERNGALSCEADGGTVSSISDHQIFCNMTAVSQ